VEEKKTIDNLYNLILASLISEGEFVFNKEANVLTVPFSRSKSLYLLDIIKDGQLKDFITVDINKEQFQIHSYEHLGTVKNQWYRGSSKIFSKVLDPGLLNVDSIIICINLFGIKKIDSLSIPTTIDKEYLKTLTYCMEKHLNVPVISGKNQIKITNISNLIQNNIGKIPAIHSAALINFLTNKERKNMISGGSLI
jgi:hypothetical protein